MKHNVTLFFILLLIFLQNRGYFTRKYTLYKTAPRNEKWTEWLYVTSNNWSQSLNQEFNGGQAFNIISVNIENDLKELNDKKSNSLEVFWWSTKFCTHRVKSGNSGKWASLVKAKFIDRSKSAFHLNFWFWVRNAIEILQEKLKRIWLNTNICWKMSCQSFLATNYWAAFCLLSLDQEIILGTKYVIYPV